MMQFYAMIGDPIGFRRETHILNEGGDWRNNDFNQIIFRVLLNYYLSA